MNRNKSNEKVLETFNLNIFTDQAPELALSQLYFDSQLSGSHVKGLLDSAIC